MKNRKLLIACKIQILKKPWQKGITIVEYAIAAALIAAAVLVAFGALGNQIGLVLNNIITSIG